MDRFYSFHIKQDIKLPRSKEYNQRKLLVLKSSVQTKEPYLFLLEHCLPRLDFYSKPLEKSFLINYYPM
jgi:hypothetical protein